MTYDDLEAIIIEFSEFESAYKYFRSDNPEPVIVELEGLTGRQQGNPRPISSQTENYPDRYVPITKFVDRVESIATKRDIRHEVEKYAPDDLTDEEFEDYLDEEFAPVLANWWSTMLLPEIELDGHRVDIEWMDGDEQFSEHMYFVSDR